MTSSSDSPTPPRPHVLFQLSGSIAAYKACHVVSRLVQAGCEVQTVATRSALEFVGEATLEGLTGRPVATDVFARGSYMDHIHLIRWADLVVLCPATANTINRLAAGLGDDLISTLFLAHHFDKPYVVAPAMNVAMYRHPATRRSLEQLQTWGLEILEPGAGSLACGEVGEGRLLEPELILTTLTQRIEQLGFAVGAVIEPVSRAPVGPIAASDSVAPIVTHPAPLDILVTSGGTAVLIDGVRRITNTSTGSTGAMIAEHLATLGHSITLVHARDAVLPPNDIVNGSPSTRPITLIPYTTFPELDEVLRHELGSGRFDAVIHLAAVSDFDVDHLVVDGTRIVPNPFGKIDSGDSLEIHLRKNHKILSRLKEYASSGSGDGARHLPERRRDRHERTLTVIGFKLTNGASADERRQAVQRITPGTDFVVHNDITEIDDQRHLATIYHDGEPFRFVTRKAALASLLGALISERTQTASLPKATA